MRSARLATLATVLCLVLACAGSGGNSPTAPTGGAQGTLVANVSVTAFTVTPSIVGNGRSYLVSFTMTETSGRASVTVTTIRFGLGSTGSANADPSPPLRLAAGGSASSGNITLNDSGGATSSITAISVTVGFADDSGRSGNASGSASFTQPSSPPAGRTFTLAGVVSDGSGRAIRGATVTATDSTNLARTGSSDGNGYFSIAPLREGEVRASVAASGFQSISRTVTLASDSRLDWTLVENSPPPPPVASASCPVPPYTWDANVQRCRAPNGQFALSACCGR